MWFYFVCETLRRAGGKQICVPPFLVLEGGILKTVVGDVFTDLIFHRRKPPGYQRKNLQPQGTAGILSFSFGENLGLWDQGFLDKTT